MFMGDLWLINLLLCDNRAAVVAIHYHQPELSDWQKPGKYHTSDKRHTRSRYSTKVVEDRGMPQSATCESQVIVNLNRVDGHLDSTELAVIFRRSHWTRKKSGRLDQTNTCSAMSGCDRSIDRSRVAGEFLVFVPASQLLTYLWVIGRDCYYSCTYRPSSHCPGLVWPGTTTVHSTVLHHRPSSFLRPSIHIHHNNNNCAPRSSSRVE